MKRISRCWLVNAALYDTQDHAILWIVMAKGVLGNLLHIKSDNVPSIMAIFTLQLYFLYII